MENDREQYPEGHFVNIWIGVGIALGAGMGVPFGIAIGNPAFIGIGLPIGLSIGVAIGSSIEAQYRKEGKIRPLTEEEQKNKKRGMKIGIASGIGLLIVGILLFIAFMLT